MAPLLWFLVFGRLAGRLVAALLATKLCCIRLVSVLSCVFVGSSCGKKIAQMLGKLMVCVKYGEI